MEDLIEKLNEARRLSEEGKLRPALDLAFDALDRALLARRFTDVDAALAAFAFETAPLDLSVTVLTTTRPAHDFLTTRTAALARFRTHVERTPILLLRAQTLLRGL